MENYELNFFIAKDAVLFLGVSLYFYFKLRKMHDDIQKAKNSSLMVWQKVLTLQ